MRPNVNIYGTPDKWVSFDSVGDLADLKKPVFTGAYDTETSSLLAALKNEYMFQNEPFDKSISPWLINKNSDFMKLTYHGINSNGDIASITGYESNVDIPFFISTGRYPYVEYAKRWDNPDILTEASSTYSLIQPIVQFDYSKIVLVPYIWAYPDENNNYGGDAFSISAYFNGVNNVNYPYVKGLYIDVFCGEAGSRQRITQFQFNIQQIIPTNNLGIYDFGLSTSFNQYCAPILNSFNSQSMSTATAPAENTGNNIFKWYLDNNYTGFSGHFGSVDNWRPVLTELGAPTSTYSVILKNPSREYFLKEMAYLGFWFADSSSHAINGVTSGNTSTGVYLSEIDENGVTTGNYFTGSETLDKINNNWGVDVYEKTPYNPYPDGEDRGDLTSNIFSGGLTAGQTYYAVSANTFNSLIGLINSYSPTADEFTADFKGINPNDYITSCKYYPVIKTSTFHLTSHIDIGKLSFNLPDIQVVPYEYGQLFDFGSIKIDRYFNDFRDYAPYTNILLQTPIGSTVIDNSYFLNHFLNVKMAVDYVTGSAICYIFRDNLLIDTINGNYGVDIPLTSIANGTYQTQIKQAQQNLSNARTQEAMSWLSIVASGASIIGGLFLANPLLIAGGTTGLITGAVKQANANRQTETADFMLKHISPMVTNISAASPLNSLVVDRRCRLLISRPDMLQSDIDKYGHTIGFACDKSGKISDFKGFTVCANVNLSGVNCTDTEKEQLKSMLQRGVIL